MIKLPAMIPEELNLNRDAYNKIAEDWAKSRDGSFVSEVIKDFAAQVAGGGKILDIGCGTGYPVASYFSEQGFAVTGIDIAEKLLQKAVDRKLVNATFSLCDFFDFEPTEKYDGIIAFDSFFHFPKEKQRTIYARVSQWMNENACLLFTHGNIDGEIKGEMFNEMFYYSSLATDEVCRLLSDAALEIVWCKEMYVEKDTDRGLVILAKRNNNA